MRLSSAVAATLLSIPALAMAQTAPAAPPAASSTPSPAPVTAPAAPAPKPDTVVAKVGDHEILLRDLSEAAQTLPDEVRSMPPQVLYPMLLDQLVDREALVIEARKEGLENEPQVKQAVARATNQVLQNALLSRDIGPSVTDAALHARYDATIAKKPGEEEVHAEHILVGDEDAAKKIIDQLNHGADFAALAKAQSKDPSAAQNGGDLGYFKKSEMVPEFANAAFALKPGEFTQTPIKTQFGWHVIKLIDRRVAPPPTFEQSREQLRQEIIQAGVRQELDKARVGLVVQKFNMDGTPMAPAAPITPNPTSTPTTDLPPTPGATPPAVPK